MNHCDKGYCETGGFAGSFSLNRAPQLVILPMGLDAGAYRCTSFGSLGIILD